MTTPTGENQQGNYGQQPYEQQPYPQQYQQQAPPPNPYGQAGYPPPPYGSPAGYPAPGYGMLIPARPGMVTAAAVLSFIWGGFSVLASIVALAAGSFVSGARNLCDSIANQTDQATGIACESTRSAGGFLIVIGLILIVAAALLIWGGVVALTGKNSKIGVIAGGLLILAQIVSMIASGGGFAFAIAGIIVPVLIIAFLMNGTSKAWFKSRGGSTF
ncbi:MAG: hypothetical protein ABI382_08325 [Nakamurella sp.]